MSNWVIFAVISLVALLLNVPMGYWRSMVKKFSVQWFLSVHLAVPLIYILRIKSGLGYAYIPALVVCAVLGQIIGGKIESV